MYGCHHQPTVHLKNLIQYFLAIKVFRKERPDVIISSGAAVAVPFLYRKYWVQKLFTLKFLIDMINQQSGRKLVYPMQV